MRRVLVTGGSSIVGHFLLPRLAGSHDETYVVSRSSPRGSTHAGVRWHVADITLALPPEVHAPHVVHLAPLWLLPPLIAPLAGAGMQRLVALSSTSRFTKHASPDAAERRLADSLASAEDAVAASCAASSVTWTLLRPTLIYGAGLDANLSRIARFVSRFGFFPLPSDASGLRQPLHADDVAQACCAALTQAAAANQSYDLSGGTTLTYREMVEHVFRGLGREPRILHVRPALFRFALRLLATLPGGRGVSPAMGDRMLEDLCFDHAAAARDLDFRPRVFSYPG